MIQIKFAVACLNSSEKKINIVLTDQTVMFGELSKVSDLEIVLRNMRLEAMKYPWTSIVEIYLDATE